MGLCIPQSSSVNGTSTSDGLVSYPGHSLGGGSAVSVFKELTELGEGAMEYSDQKMQEIFLGLEKLQQLGKA